MNRLSKILLLCAFVGIAGCASKKQMTRAEYMAATQRTYSQTPEQIFTATEKLFRLNDGDDYTITHKKDEMTAIRNWETFYVFAAAAGSDTWTVKTEPAESGKVRVTADANTVGGANSGGMKTLPPTGPAVYELFFRRLDYLLGLRKDWTTCDQIKAEYVAGKTWGNTRALCLRQNMKNTDPTTGKSEYPFENGKK